MYFKRSMIILKRLSRNLLKFLLGTNFLMNQKWFSFVCNCSRDHAFLVKITFWNWEAFGKENWYAVAHYHK